LSQIRDTSARLYIILRESRAGGKTPVAPGLGALVCSGGSCYVRGKIFWARADVWRLLFSKVTTKKGRQKIDGQLL